MKHVTTIVRFFITKDNMEYLLHGHTIDNFDEMRNNLFTELNSNGSVLVYKPRDESYDSQSEYPNIKDRIVAKILRYIKEKDALEIEILDSLYFSKLYNPKIKLNGYCISEDGSIHIKKITRLTLADDYINN